MPLDHVQPTPKPVPATLPEPPRDSAPTVLPTQTPPDTVAVQIYVRCAELWRILRRHRFFHPVAESTIDNVVYEAFRKEKAPGAEPIRDLQAWVHSSLMLAARQEAFRTLKHRQCDFAVLVAVAAQEHDSEMTNAICTAIWLLPAREAEAVIRTVMQGQSFAEAADAMGCVASTVLRSRTRGLGKLRTLLAHLNNGENPAK